jgi:hypothetical protein
MMGVIDGREGTTLISINDALFAYLLCKFA